MSGDLKWRIEHLTQQHDVSSFDCGRPPLNNYLKRFALINQNNGLNQAFVAVTRDGGNVKGYHVISAGAVAFSSVPSEFTKGVPKYPIPTGHLGRLAVDREVQGQGLGEFLLMDALERIIRAADLLGIHAVEVFAKDDDAKRFYLKYGFTPLQDDELHLYLPIRLVKKLGLV